MKYTYLLAISLLLLLFSCRPISTDLSLDDLTDKTDYTGGMVVNSEKYRGQKVGRIVLNGSEEVNPEVLDLQTAGYYRIEIFLKNGDQNSPEVIRLVILDPERGNPDWGLPPWTPKAAEKGAIGNQSVKLLYPPAIPLNISIPLIAIVGEELTVSDQNLDAGIGSQKFRIKRGVGSVELHPENAGADLKIGSRSFVPDISTIESVPKLLSGVLTGDLEIPAGSYLQITDDLTIPAGMALSIGSGTFVTVGPGVDIMNQGSVTITGSADAPVTITCSEDEAWWGGFINSLAGNRLEASYAIFCRSGYHTEGDYNYGHAHRQALFYIENGKISLDHCYMTDHVGQIFYPVASDLSLTDCLIQRAKTGGQMNRSLLVMDRCVFTDFPDDSDQYRDEDNDGLYLDETDATIQNSVFMYAKDDGLDSGASGGGEVVISNCRFEANFHEGAALSSGHSVTKLHKITHSLFTNCGQGLELGYSSPNHTVQVDSCRFTGNGIGIRYGDCYDFPHHGTIHVANSESLGNSVYDVWNMNREHWAADTSHMSFENVTVSIPSPLYPELILDEN